MSDYVLTCSSTVDLPKAYLEGRGIPYVCFHYRLGQEEHMDDLWEAMDARDFYSRMVGGEEAKTSQVNVEEYMDFFRPFLEEEKDILHIELSSGLSGSYNSARLAAEELRTKFPDRKIGVVDSRGASSGFGFLLSYLADQRDEGLAYEQLMELAEEKKLLVHHWFFSTDLTFYVKGGRISKTAGFLGGMLGICPLLNMDEAGHLIPREKIRGKQKVMQRIVEKMLEHAEGGPDYQGKVFISQSDCLEDAEGVAALVKELFPQMDGEVMINPIGPTIGAHTGPGTVALFFFGDKRI